MMHAAVREWLTQHTPLETALLEGAGFSAMVAERIASAAAGSEPAYVQLLGRSPGEVERLIGGIAVAETWLFRYPRAFDVLVEHLRRRREMGGARLRLASIGCASGQEPYCMAMSAVHAGWEPEQVSVEAVDRNPEVLAAAATARYGPLSIRGEIPSWAAPFLQREGESVRVEPRIRSMVQFRRMDAAEWSSEAPLDAVFCRNLLIYLNADVRARLIRSIRDSLAIGGLFFVGHAEMIVRNEPLLRPLGVQHAFALERIGQGASRAATDEPPARAKANAGRPIVPSSSARGTVAGAVPTPAVAAAQGTLEDARSLADAGRAAESEDLVRLLIAKQGPSASALELLGLIRMASNDVMAAKRCFEQAVYLEPNLQAALLQLAMIHEHDGDARGAAAYWDRARRASVTVDRERLP